MSLEQEFYEDHSRKQRRSSFIKGALLTTIIIAAVSWFWRTDIFVSSHIALFDISGEMFDDPSRNDILKEISENSNVEGLLVSINSPGGSVVVAEETYTRLRKIAKKKPVVVVIGEVGASGAYIAALGGDIIFARENSLIGSIGVLVQYPDLSELAKVLGISVDIIKSGELKGGSHILKGMNEKERLANKALVDESFQWFKNLVSERRKINMTNVNQVSDGRLFTGSMALDLGLIDGIGSNEDALEYFKLQGIDILNLPLIKWNTENSSRSLLDFIFGLPASSGITKSFKSSLGPRLISIAS